MLTNELQNIQDAVLNILGSMHKKFAHTVPKKDDISIDTDYIILFALQADLDKDLDANSLLQKAQHNIKTIIQVCPTIKALRTFFSQIIPLFAMRSAEEYGTTALPICSFYLPTSQPIESKLHNEINLVSINDIDVTQVTQQGLLCTLSSPFYNSKCVMRDFEYPKQLNALLNNQIKFNSLNPQQKIICGYILWQLYIVLLRYIENPLYREKFLGKEAYAKELEEEREVQDLLKQIVRNRKKKLDLSEIETQAEDIVKKKKAPHIEQIEKNTAEESIEQLLLGSRYMSKSAKKRLINLLLEIPSDEEDLKDSKSETEEIKEEKPKKKSIAQKRLFKKLASNKAGLKEFEKWMQSHARQELQKCNTHMALRAEHKFNNKTDEELFFNKYQALIATLSTLNESKK